MTDIVYAATARLKANAFPRTISVAVELRESKPFEDLSNMDPSPAWFDVEGMSGMRRQGEGREGIEAWRKSTALGAEQGLPRPFDPSSVHKARLKVDPGYLHHRYKPLEPCIKIDLWRLRPAYDLDVRSTLSGAGSQCQYRSASAQVPGHNTSEPQCPMRLCRTSTSRGDINRTVRH